MENKKYTNHFFEEITVFSSPERVFAYADNHLNLSSHMNKSSWMLGGGKMQTVLDKDIGQKIGSHIRMHGNVFGLNIFLDEIVTEYNPPFKKVWKTVGDLNLLVIDHYQLGFELKSEKSVTLFKVFINYNLPNKSITKWLGILLGNWYAKWCVQQMINGIKLKFNN